MSACIDFSSLSQNLKKETNSMRTHFANGVLEASTLNLFDSLVDLGTDSLPSETLCEMTSSPFDQWFSSDYFLMDSVPPAPANSLLGTPVDKSALLESSPLLKTLSLPEVTNPSLLFETLSCSSLCGLPFQPILDVSNPLTSSTAKVQSLRSSVSASLSLNPPVKREFDFIESLPPEIALKRRRQPAKRVMKLPAPEPAEPETDDPTVEKRRKNTDAARRSRLRKTLRMDSLEERVSSLEADNAKLTTAVSMATKENSSLRVQNLEYAERIRTLEQQLSESYKLLLGKLQTE